MPNLNPIETQLLQVVSGASPASIADVIAVMQCIDRLLPSKDGLRWFNRLYLTVTHAPTHFLIGTQRLQIGLTNREDDQLLIYLVKIDGKTVARLNVAKQRVDRDSPLFQLLDGLQAPDIARLKSDSFQELGVRQRFDLGVQSCSSLAGLDFPLTLHRFVACLIPLIPRAN